MINNILLQYAIVAKEQIAVLWSKTIVQGNLQLAYVQKVLKKKIGGV